MSELGIQPEIHDHVPYCTQMRCQQYDGKRCRIMGSRPGVICEPAVERMSLALIKLDMDLSEVIANEDA